MKQEFVSNCIRGGLGLHTLALPVGALCKKHMLIALLVLILFGDLHSDEANKPLPRININVSPENSSVAENIRSLLSLSSESCDSQRWLIEALGEMIESEADAALRALGYYSGTSQYKLSFTKNCWALDLDVSSGKPTMIDQVFIEVIDDGNDHPRFSDLSPQYPVVSGQQLNHGNYSKTKNMLRSTALELGYLEATFKRSDLVVNPPLYKANVYLKLDTGKRYKTGKLMLSDIYLDKALLKRLINLPEGSPYNANEVARSYRTLKSSGYFTKVIIKPQLTINSQKTIDIDTELELVKRHAWRFGLGYRTDIGMRTSVSYENRYVNHRGDRANIDLQVAQELSQFEVQYRMLGKHPLRDYWTIGLQAAHEDTDEIESDRLRTGIALNRYDNNINYQLRLDYLKEKSILGNQEIDSHFIIPAARADWRHVDNDTNPTKGITAFVELQAASESLASSTDFFRFDIGSKFLFPLGKGSLIGRFELGMLSTSDYSQIPASLRFFAGGDESVRGYGYQELGPVDESGKAVGGKYLLTSSIEYQHPVKDDIAAAFFIDTGNTFNSWDTDLKYSAGVGVRWKTPAGRLKIDLAIPNDRSRDNFRIHIGFGVEI